MRKNDPSLDTPVSFIATFSTISLKEVNHANKSLFTFILAGYDFENQKQLETKYHIFLADFKNITPIITTKINKFKGLVDTG